MDGLSLFAAVIASAAAQFLLRTNAYAAGVTATLLAVGLSWRAVAPGTHVVGPARFDPPMPSPLLPPHCILLVAALVAWALTLGLQTLDQHDLWQLGLWVLAIGLLNASYVEPGGWRRWQPTGESLFVLAIVAAGSVARLYHLDSVPGGFYGDEGEFGVKALALLDGARVRAFETGWDMHPTLFTYLQAGAMALTARDVAGVRLASALAGGLTLWPWYWFLRRAAGFWVALAGTMFVAASPWDLHFTRLASNNAFVALFTVLGMSALFRATRTGKASAYVAAGTSLGLSFYFGNKAVLLPPMMVAGLCALAVVDGVAVRRQWRHWLLAVVVALFVAAPQLRYYASHDWYGALLYHPASKLISLYPEAGGAEPARAVQLLRQQIERSLLAFQYYSDRGVYQTASGFPLLTAAEATAFLLGLGYALRRWRTALAAFLLAWFAVGIQGSLLSRDPPQVHHLIGMITVPAAFAAIGFDVLRARLAATWPGGARVISGIALLACGVLGIREYFIGYARNWPIREITGIARAMRQYGTTHDLVLVTLPMMVERNGTFRFIAYGIRATDQLVKLPAKPWFKPTERDVVFVVDGRMPGALDRLQTWYPHGRLQEQFAPDGTLVAATYEVARAAIAAAHPPPP